TPGCVPVHYPGANVPQAWAAGSIFQLVTAMLSLRADTPNRTLYVNPTLDEWLPDLEMVNPSGRRASAPAVPLRGNTHRLGGSRGWWRCVPGRTGSAANDLKMRDQAGRDTAASPLWRWLRASRRRHLPGIDHPPDSIGEAVNACSIAYLQRNRT